MRIAVIADLHGRRGSWRRVITDAERHGADRVVLLGDYLDSLVSKRDHDPSLPWVVDTVVRSDPALWRELAMHDLVLGNQEERIRDLLPPAAIDDCLAPLLAAPTALDLPGLRLVHGHELAWLRDDPARWLPPLPGPGAPSVTVAGHSHQVLLLDELPSRRVIPVVPGRPVEVAEGDRLFVNGGPARGKPTRWLSLDLDDTQRLVSLTFHEAPW